MNTNSEDSKLERINLPFNSQANLDIEFADFLINQIIDAAFCLDENAQFIYVNPATCNLTGYSREELLSMNLSDLDMDFSSHNWPQQWQYLTKIKTISFKSRYRTKAARIFFGEIYLTYRKHKNLEFCCGFLQERSDDLIELSLHQWKITNKNIPQNASAIEIANITPQNIDLILKFSEHEFHSLLESTNCCILLIQGENFSYVNHAVELLTGYTQQEILSNFAVNQFLEIRKSPNCQVSNSDYQEIKIITKDGRARWLVGAVINLDSGLEFEHQEFELIIALDITHYKYTELELSQSLEQAKELIKLRANFVSIICHQFRTPLNVISFSNSLLKRNISKWKTRKILLSLKQIQTAVTDINQVLDNILFFFKMESSNMIVEHKNVDLVKFCKKIIKKILIINGDKNINIENMGKCSAVWIDEKILEPILSNLLDNALKYSPANSVVDFIVDCDPQQIKFQIRDKGIGIPDINQDKLFEPFYRGSNVEKIPGTGLGLSIVKTLVDLYGGEITVSSEVGVGTTFTLVLPSFKPVNSESS